jgi:DNA polymerase
VERGYSSDLAAELASTLDWWVEAGVDCLVEDQPRDWLKPAPRPMQGPDSSLVPSEVEGRNDEAGASAPRLRSGRAETVAPVHDPLPDQLPLLLDWFRTSPSLPYAAPSAPRICPSGDPAAGLMIIAAMPSSEDCTTGTMISGAAGRLFDRMLAAIGRSRDTAYIAGLSCLRPAAGRMDPAGAARCAEIARHHVGLADPKAVLLLGDACSRALLGLGAAEARGRVHQLEARGRSFRAVVTLHPDYLLSQPAAKALAWTDLQLLMEALS